MELEQVLEFVIECDSAVELGKIFNATEFRLDELKVWSGSNVDEDEDIDDEDMDLVGVT